MRPLVSRLGMDGIIRYLLLDMRVQSVLVSMGACATHRVPQHYPGWDFAPVGQCVAPESGRLADPEDETHPEPCKEEREAIDGVGDRVLHLELGKPPAGVAGNLSNDGMLPGGDFLCFSPRCCKLRSLWRGHVAKERFGIRCRGFVLCGCLGLKCSRESTVEVEDHHRALTKRPVNSNIRKTGP
jgi:hypothetical protein